MTRNQKIALGCGGAGCLGLIVVVIAAGLIYLFTRPNRQGLDYDISTTNRNSNSNDNSDLTTNDNSSSTSTSSASSMSDDEKHRLYQAAVMTGDQELIRRVSVAIGLMDEDYTPGENYSQFLTAHVSWVLRNSDFIRSLDTADKARDYVNEHFPD